MDITAELRGQLMSLAGPREWSDTRESWLSRAARKAGISHRMAKSIYYRECADPKASIAARIRAASDEQEAQRARSEYAELAARVARLEAQLEASLVLPGADQSRAVDHADGNACRAMDSAVDRVKSNGSR